MKRLSPQELGRLRDRRIVEFVTKFGAVRTNQIVAALFPSKAGVKLCQRRLRTLVRRGRLRRERLTDSAEYLYRVTRCGQIQHRQAVADFYIRALMERRAGEELNFTVEYPLAGAERADGLLIWQTPKGIWRAFVEVQRNGHCELAKYARYLRSGIWRQETWSNAGQVFPMILVEGSFRRKPAHLVVKTLADSVRATLGVS